MNETTHSFKDKVAFITGSSRGIGKATALKLAKQGCHIILHYNKNKEAALNTKTEIETLDVKTWLYQADLCDTLQTEKLLENICTEHKHLDIFIVNAASTAFKSLA